MDFSNIQWGPVAGQLLRVGAPILGTILGGPAGAVVGTVASAIAGMLDTEPTPEAISTALATNPNAGAILAQYESQNSETLLALKEEQLTERARIEQVGLSMRSEVAAGDRFQRWARPFNMYMVGAVTGSYGLVIVISAVQALITRQYDSLRIIMEAGPSLGIALTPAGAVAGVTAWQTSKEKIAGVFQRPISTVKKK